ncbi:MAG: flagellin [Betaproteobacteria bacterium]|jgi:flagellin
MPQFINTNIASLNAQRNLNGSQNSLNVALQRLSTGLRINSAKDDAAGLAISERFTSQIRGLNQAARNASDGISLAQTAEGALNEITNNLQRIRELAVQSANATNSASDRAALQAEVSDLVAEIDRVATQTGFNGVKLLDGTFSAQAFQVGADAGQTITVSSITSARTTSLGASFSASVTSGVVTANAIAAGDLVINGVDIGAIGTNDARSVAAAINAVGGHGATATANSLTVSGGTTDGGTAGTGTLTINGYTTSTISIGAGAAVDRAALASAINAISAATGVTAVNDGTGIDLVAADGRNIVHSFTQATGTFNATLTGVAAAATTRSTVTLTASQNITISGTAPSDAGFSAATTSAALSGTALSNISVATLTGANTTLASVDAALTSVNSSRAALGALQNRFSSVVSNLQTSSENLTASRSRIQDADFAAETAQLTKAQIMQQAGVAMLAQANALPNNVLALLRN